MLFAPDVLTYISPTLAPAHSKTDLFSLSIFFISILSFF